MGQYALLFRPIEIGSLALKNRVVMAPMTSGYGSADGYATQTLIDYYVARARGGVGLITCESCYVEKGGKGFVGHLALDHDRYIPALARLTKSVHEAGAKVVLQLIHCGRQTSSALCGGQPVAPSAIPCPVIREMPRELTPHEIEGIVLSFLDSASRAKEAGFDGVEIHAAHGYLINQFLSSYSNRRSDMYGGDLFDRCRMLIEIIRGIKGRLGEPYPVFSRLSAEEFVPNGLTLGDTTRIAKWLQNAGLDALSISGGVYESAYRIIPPMDVEQGSLVHLAQSIKASVSIPVFAVGGINEPDFADRILIEGKADLVVLGRALLADPEWVAKVQRGEAHRIRACLFCNHCRNRPLRPKMNCAVNYEAGREGENVLTRPTRKPREVIIVGGGISGMEAAYVASLRGHRVSVYERTSELGGNLLLASLPPHRGRLRRIVEFLRSEIERAGVQVFLNVEAKAETIREMNPDVILLATGSDAMVPDIPGVQGANVHLATDVLKGRTEPGKYVVVIGGGLLGLETADYLREKGKAVTVVERLPEVAMDSHVESVFKRYLLARLTRSAESVLILPSTEVTQIGPDHVRIRQASGERVLAGIDTVVLAAGLRPFLPMRPEQFRPKAEVHILGDALRPQTLFEAIHSAAEVAYGL